ncbi:MAG: 3-dehydroquinate synthase, partial [Nocardioides sp.]
MRDTVLHVGGASPYDVVVGHALGHRLPAMLGDGVERVAVVRPAGLDDVVETLRPALDGYDVIDLSVPDGEDAKTADVAASCWARLGEA